MQSPGLYVQTENETVMDILMIDHQMNQQVLAAVSPIEENSVTETSSVKGPPFTVYA